MRQETYRFAYEEAAAELRDVVERFEQLRRRKDRVEKVMEALRPFAGLAGEATTADQAAAAESLYLVPEAAEVSHEPIKYAVEPAPEPVRIAAELTLEPVMSAAEVSPEPVQYVPEPSHDPFQRRIDSVLWGWSQKREGMLPAV